jgi:uncharacterized membrane protein
MNHWKLLVTTKAMVGSESVLNIFLNTIFFLFSMLLGFVFCETIILAKHEENMHKLWRNERIMFALIVSQLHKYIDKGVKIALLQKREIQHHRKENI